MQAVTITQITAPELESLIENSLRKILASHTQPQPTKDQDELLTVQQAADFLSLSVPTIYGLIHQNKLPVMKRSKRCYFSKVELMDYLKEGRRSTAGETAVEIDDYLVNQKRRG